jgi:hypothetical protein
MKSRRLQKTLELNMTWHPQESSIRGKDPSGRSGPRGSPPQTGRPHGGAGRPPPGTTSALLLEYSSTAYADQSKLYVRSV